MGVVQLNSRGCPTFHGIWCYVRRFFLILPGSNAYYFKDLTAWWKDSVLHGFLFSQNRNHTFIPHSIGNQTPCLPRKISSSFFCKENVPNITEQSAAWKKTSNRYWGWNGLMATTACKQEIPANSNIYITFNELWNQNSWSQTNNEACCLYINCELIQMTPNSSKAVLHLNTFTHAKQQGKHPKTAWPSTVPKGKRNWLAS